MITNKKKRCPRDEIGRHTGFKIPGLHGRAGSSPAWGTTFSSLVSSILTATYPTLPIILDIICNLSVNIAHIWTLSRNLNYFSVLFVFLFPPRNTLFRGKVLCLWTLSYSVRQLPSILLVSPNLGKKILWVASVHIG